MPYLSIIYKKVWVCLSISLFLLSMSQKVVLASPITNSQFVLEGALISTGGASAGAGFSVAGDTAPYASPHVNYPGRPVPAPFVSSGGGGGGGGSTSVDKILTILNKPIVSIPSNQTNTDLNNALNNGSLGTGVTGYDVNGIPIVNYGKLLCSIPFRKSNFGSIGPYVAFIQKILSDYKINTGKIDGKYMSKTKQAVRLLQLRYKNIYSKYTSDTKPLLVDGIWGKQTHDLVQLAHCKSLNAKKKIPEKTMDSSKSKTLK